MTTHQGLEQTKILDDELAHNDYNYPLDWFDGAPRLYSDKDVVFEQNRFKVSWPGLSTR